MCNICTPILAVAAAGLSGGLGLDMASGMNTQLTTFTNVGSLSGAAQSLLATPGVDPSIVNAVKTIPSFASGVIPTGLVAQIPAGLSLNNNNLIGDIIGRTDALLANGPTGLIKNLDIANGFAQNNFNLLGSLQQISGMNLADNPMGYTLNSIRNLATAGIGSQFSNLSSGAFTAFTGQLTNNFGTMFKVGDLSAFTPNSVAQNLIDQGFGDAITGAIARVAPGADVTNLANIDPRIIQQAMGTIQGSALNQIVDSCQFIPQSSLGSLADVLDPAKVLSSASQSLFPDLVTRGLSAVSDRLGAIAGNGGNFESWQDWGNMLSGFTEPSLSYLNTASANTTNWQAVFAPLLSTQAGSGVFNNPTMTDILGSLTGEGYTGNITVMTSGQTSLMGSALGTNLMAAINAAKADPTNASLAGAISSAAAAITGSGNAQVQALVSQGDTAFTNTFNRYVAERVNQDQAGIDTTLTGTKSDVMSWIPNLHTLHQDDMSLGYGDLVKNLATNDLTGEAIRVAIEVEGPNLANLQKYGLSAQSTVNPTEYAKQISGGP